MNHEIDPFADIAAWQRENDLKIAWSERVHECLDYFGIDAEGAGHVIHAGTQGTVDGEVMGLSRFDLAGLLQRWGIGDVDITPGVPSMMDRSLRPGDYWRIEKRAAA